MATRQLCAHVMGLDRATGKWFFLASDAKTRVYPGSPTSVMTPLPSTGIRLGAAGTARSITIPGHGQRPHLLLRGPGAEILLNPGGGIVLPSVTDRPQRRERRRCLGLCELTLGRQRMAGADRHAQRDRAAGAEPQPGRAPPRLDGDVERLPRPLHHAGLAEIDDHRSGDRHPIGLGHARRPGRRQRTADIPSRGQPRPTLQLRRVQLQRATVRDHQRRHGQPVRSSRRGVEPRHGGGQSEPARCHRQRVLPRLDDEPLRAADPCIHRRRRRGYAFPYDDVRTTGYNTEDRVVDPHPTRLTIRVG